MSRNCNIRTYSPWQYRWYLIGNLLQFSGFFAVYALIPSVHVKDGIGTTALAISYSSTIIPAMFVPFFTERYGIKSMFLAAASLWLLFILGNFSFHAAAVTLAGVMNGLAESIGWTMISLITVYFSRQAEIANKKPRGHYSKMYFSQTWCCLKLSNGLGNALTLIILYIDRNVINQRSTVHFDNATSVDDVYRSYCGANDCQDPNITMNNMQQYSTVNEATYYIIIGMSAALVLLAGCIHLVNLPRDLSEVSDADVDVEIEARTLQCDDGDQHNVLAAEAPLHCRWW